MHELSLAQAVVDVSLRHAAGRRVRRVEVRVGALRQVVPEALRFAFELVSEGTELEGAELEIQEVAAAGVCRVCQTRSTMRAFPLQCSRCGGLELEIVAGEELVVDALELESELTTGGVGHGR